MAVESPVSRRLTVTALLLLTFATGLVDAVSVLELGHVFVANMTGNVVFLGFWLAPRTVVDVTAALVAFGCFVAGAVIGGRMARHLDGNVRRWLGVALVTEVVLLSTLSILAGAGVLDYHDNRKLILIAGLAVTSVDTIDGYRFSFGDKGWLLYRLSGTEPLGLIVPNTLDVELLHDHLPRFALIALQFPKWTDGRAYSQARLLRARLRYTGEVRATGEVLVDMLPLLHRSGVDAVLMRPDQSLDSAQRALRFFAGHYQGDVHEARPLFARTPA